jgi:hypothetical protein
VWASTVTAQVPKPVIPSVTPPPTMGPLVASLRFENAPNGAIELGALVGGEVVVRAAGGYGDLTLTLETTRPDVVTLAAPTRSGAQVARAGGGAIAPVPAMAAPRDAMIHKDKPATPIERAVRLAPFTRLAAAGGPISVIVRATDSRGTQASATFSIVPVAARITNVSKPTGTVRGQTIALGVDVDLLPPGARLEITGSVPAAEIKPRATVCAFNVRQSSSASAPGATAGTSGSMQFTVPGRFFAYDHAKNGPCAVVLKARLVRAGTPDESIEFRKMDLALSTPVPYVVQGTWALRDRLAFDVHPGLPGFCTGLSVGGPPQAIGVHQAGADLAIGVRSGPAGTDCAARSAVWTLPDGFEIASIDWDTLADGNACCVGNACLPSTSTPDTSVIVPGAIPSENADVYQSNAVSDADKPSPRADGSLPPFVSRMHVRLGCKATAFNDHGVKVVLKSVGFEGPAGVNFP